MALDLLTLAAPSGSDGGLGKIGSIPIGGVLYVRCPVGPNIERVEWLIDNSKAATYQLFKADGVVDALTLTLNALADGETLTIAGLTCTAEDTLADCAAATRKFYTGGADATADAVALAALINDPASGFQGLQASSAAGVVTVTPKFAGGTYALQAATGTAGAHVAVAQTTLASLIRAGGLVSVAADTTTKEFSVTQYVDGWIPYLCITNTDGAAVNAVTVRVCRYPYRD